MTSPLCHICQKEESKSRCPRCSRLVCSSCSNGNLCSLCSEEISNEADRRLQIEDQRFQDQAAKKQAIYSTNTHKGRCPNCGSKNVVEYRVNTGIARKSLWACLIPILGMKSVIEINRECVACNHKWRK